MTHGQKNIKLYSDGTGDSLLREIILIFWGILKPVRMFSWSWNNSSCYAS